MTSARRRAASSIPVLAVTGACACGVMVAFPTSATLAGPRPPRSGPPLTIPAELHDFVASPTATRPRALRALQGILEEAQHAGLLVDVTGDIVWHPEDSPAWYEAPGEHARWQVQARFWRAAARVGAGSPSVLCYELTSEPAIGDSDAWYTGLLLHYYVQYVDTSTNADALYRENLITFLGLRATLSASPAVPFAP